MKSVEQEEKLLLSIKVKEAVKNLNSVVKEARCNGLSVELKTDSCVMAENTLPLQVKVFEQVDY